MALPLLPVLLIGGFALAVALNRGGGKSSGTVIDIRDADHFLAEGEKARELERGAVLFFRETEEGAAFSNTIAAIALAEGVTLLRVPVAVVAELAGKSPGMPRPEELGIAAVSAQNGDALFAGEVNPSADVDADEELPNGGTMQIRLGSVSQVSAAFRAFYATPSTGGGHFVDDHGSIHEDRTRAHRIHNRLTGSQGARPRPRRQALNSIVRRTRRR